MNANALESKNDRWGKSEVGKDSFVIDRNLERFVIELLSQM